MLNIIATALFVVNSFITVNQKKYSHKSLKKLCSCIIMPATVMVPDSYNFTDMNIPSEIHPLLWQLLCLHGSPKPPKTGLYACLLL